MKSRYDVVAIKDDIHGDVHEFSNVVDTFVSYNQRVAVDPTLTPLIFGVP